MRIKEMTRQIYSEFGMVKPKVVSIVSGPIEALVNFIEFLIDGRDIRPININKGPGYVDYVVGVDKFTRDWSKKVKRSNFTIHFCKEIMEDMVTVPPSVKELSNIVKAPMGIVRACRRSILRDNFRPNSLAHTEDMILLPTRDVAMWIRKPQMMAVLGKTTPRHGLPLAKRPGLHCKAGPAVVWGIMKQWWFNGDRLTKDMTGLKGFGKRLREMKIK